MPSKEFHQNEESDKALLAIYTYLKYSLEKIYGCKNHPENSSTKKVNEHIPLGSSMSIIISFRSIENKHNVYTEVKVEWKSFVNLQQSTQ